MSPGEVLWRVRSSVRDHVDRCLVGRRRRLVPLAAIYSDGTAEDERGFSVADIEVGQWACGHADSVERRWYAQLLARADRVALHLLSFFNLDDSHLGDPVDWHRDHENKVAAPLKFSPTIDYRDVSVTGDCKFVWEPNRHHHLVVLGRAYRASGDVRYARAAVEQLESWLDQCPFGMGMNWRSPLELGIRLINWVWTIDLIRDADVMTGSLWARLMNSLYLHVWDISRKYSRGSSVNNHLVGEAAGVFVATSYFRKLKNAARWRGASRDILRRAILEQTFPDGGTREQALGYHLFVLQFFLVAGIVARKINEDFDEPYWSRLERMFEFVGALSEGGEELPVFGDCDDGYVLDLGGNPRDVRGWLAAGAALFGRSDFKAWSGGYSEAAAWLLGAVGKDRFDALPEASVADVRSRALADSGYNLLQSGRWGAADRISVVFDCGELGMAPLAGHGHADALSFTLRAFGTEVLVDPGTYDYFSHRRWREYFRSTRAHNTIVIDSRNQSEMLGLFLWGRRAQAKCLTWQPSEHGGKVVGEHDGYRCLNDPVTHRRTLELDGRERTLAVRDDIIASGRHKVEVCFHLAEHCGVVQTGQNRYEIDAGPGKVVIELDPRLSVETLRGSEDPIGGWVSRGYHRKTASTTMVGRVVSEGEMSLVCRIDIGDPRQ